MHHNNYDNLKAKNKNILVDKRVIFILFIFNVCLFIILFLLKKGVDYQDQNLPINGFFYNKLPTTETIKLQLNDSVYLLTLDSDARKDLDLTYRKGLNKIIVFLSNSQAIVDTTLSIDTRYPGSLDIELDKPTDDLGFSWYVDTSVVHHIFYYNKQLIKEQNDKRLKFAFRGFYIE